MTKDLAKFFLVAFALSWGVWGLAACLDSIRPFALILGTFGPALAALLLAGQPGRRRDLLNRLVLWRCPYWTYVYALGLPVMGILLALVIARAVSGSGPVLPAAMPLYVPVLVFIYVLFFSVAGEELGWRGVALPRLLSAHGPVMASLVLGVIWALWHAPLFLVPGNFHAGIPPGLFAAQVIASSVLYTHLHLASRGSLIPAHLFHASFNTSVGLLPVLPATRGGDTTALLFSVMLLVALAAATAAHLSRKGR